jgi:sodium/bile acid cotransporter 7
MGAGIYFGAGGLLDDHLRLGVFFLCALSSTISSSVALVAMAKGAVPVAVFDATLSSLLGMVITPALLALVSSAGAQPLPLLPAMRDIFMSLLLPFALGQLMRPLLAPTLKRWPILGKLDRAVIILIVYAAFCNSAQAGLWSSSDLGTVALVTVLALLMLAIVLFAISRASHALNLTREDEIAATFCGATKSLVNGAPIARIVFGAGPELGMIMLPLLLYHPAQLIVCSILAKRFAAAPNR